MIISIFSSYFISLVVLGGRKSFVFDNFSKILWFNFCDLRFVVDLIIVVNSGIFLV